MIVLAVLIVDKSCIFFNPFSGNFVELLSVFFVLLGDVWNKRVIWVGLFNSIISYYKHSITKLTLSPGNYIVILLMYSFFLYIS